MNGETKTNSTPKVNYSLPIKNKEKKKLSKKQKKLKLIRLIFGETLYNINNELFIDPKDVLLNKKHIIFCRIGRSQKFDRCCLQALNGVINAIERLENKTFQLVFILTDYTKRNSIIQLVKKYIINANPLFLRRQKPLKEETHSSDSESQIEQNTSISLEDPQLYLFADQQQETVLQFPEGYEEEFDAFEQIQRYSHFNVNKFFDCVEYWTDHEKFGTETQLPPYNESSVSHLGPTFILMDLISKDFSGLCIKLDWNFFTPHRGITEVLFNFPRLVEEWTGNLEAKQPTTINSFALYNPKLGTCQDFFEYRRKMRAEKARRLKLKELVTSQRFEVLFYDLIDFMKRSHLQKIPKDKVHRTIRLLTGEDAPNFAPFSKDGIIFLYYTKPNQDFNIETQDFLPQLIKFVEAINPKYQDYFKIWWIPNLPLDEAQESKKLYKEITYVINRFQDIIEPYSFEIIDKCFESESCVRELLITRPEPPILVALDLKGTKHVLAVDYAENLNVDSLGNEPITMFKVWAKMLGVSIPS